jgi:hypothetical protein
VFLQNTETHVPVFYMALGLNDFDGGQIRYVDRGPLVGVALKNRYFIEPFSSAIWAQKSLDFSGPPLPMVIEMDLPPS